MSLHKSPLQILQSLTQKKIYESKKEKTVFPAASDIYLGKNRTTVVNSDIFSVKKNTIGNYLKASNIDVNGVFVPQSEARAKSPVRIKKAIVKGALGDFERVQAAGAERPSLGFRSVPKETINGNTTDSVMLEKRTSDLDTGELVKVKLELAYSDYQQEDYNAALAKLLKAEELVEKTLNSQAQLPFGIMHLMFYNMISAHYKLRALADCKTYLNHSLLNCHVYKEQRSYRGVLTNFRNLQEQSDYLKHVASKTQQKKYRCKMHLQACLIHSEIENHIEAYAHAKQASKLACQLLTDTLMIAYHLYLKTKEPKSPFSSDTQKGSFVDLLSASSHPTVTPSFQQVKSGAQNSKSTLQQNTYSQSTQQISETEPDEKPETNLSEAQVQHLENMIPILEEMVYKIKGRRVFSGADGHNHDSIKKRMLSELRAQFANHEFNKPDMTKLYGDLPETHFLYSLNIMGVAQIQPVNPVHFVENWTMLDAIKADTIIEEILLVIVSLYALSTELRFWDDVIKRETPQKIAICELMSEYLPLSFLKRESQLWIGRSLEFAYTFLPHNSPIAEQIFSIYSKLYNPTKFMIPEDEEIKHYVKYLNPAKGITRSSFFFIPIIRKCETEEDDGIATLLFTEKELDNSLSKAIKQIQLFDLQTKYNSLFTKNYAILQRRDSRDTQASFANKINKLLKSSEKPPTSKGVHLRKTYMNKSPFPRDERSNTSGSEFFIAEDKDQSSLTRESDSFMHKKLQMKRNSDSPQIVTGTRPSSKGGISQSQPKSPAMRKSIDKVDYTLPDAQKRDSIADISSKQEKSKSFMETYNNSKQFFRPSSSGAPMSNNDLSKQSLNNNSIINKSSTFYVPQNHEGSTLEETLLARDGSARQYSSNPGPGQGVQKRGLRQSPDGKLRVLHRRVNGNMTKEYFSQTEGSRQEPSNTQQDMTYDKSHFESSMVVMTEPNDRSTSQENERYVKKYVIPEKGPIRAMTSLRTRVKKDARTHTEGDEDSETLPGIEIYNVANPGIRPVNQSLELVQALKKRSNSNGKRPTSKITIVTIKKGKKANFP